jgi:hypothetical protein
MDITDTIAPKVDQLTADHLIGRTMTIKITDVRRSDSEQPFEIDYAGANGLPYRPGKSMRRVLVQAWGANAKKYIGRSLTLYRDDDVQFGGLKVGGLRISHMSHIAGPMTMALTAKKGSKKAFKVLPLVEEPAGPDGWPIVDLTGKLHMLKSADGWRRAADKAIATAPSVQALEEWIAAMEPHFDALAAWDADAVQAVRLAAGERLAQMMEAGNE